MTLALIIKRIANIVNHALFLPSIGLISSLLALWIIGPQITVGNIKPFASIIVQIIVSTLIITVWYIKFIYQTSETGSLNESEFASVSEPWFSEEFKILRRQCQQLLKYLKQTHLPKIGKKNSRYALQWLLVLGHKNVGKSSLIANAELSFFDTEHFVTQPPQAELKSQLCNWWITQDAVFIDPPVASSSEASSEHNYLALLRNLKLVRWRQPIDGLVVVVSLEDISKKDPAFLEAYYQQLKQQIYATLKTLKRSLPIYLVINKMDQLKGFKEFFEEFVSSDRQQPWGVQLIDNEQSIPSYSQHFNQAYTKLIKRLQDQTIWRLRHERKTDLASIIYEFPTQLELLRNTLSHLVHQFTDAAHYGNRAVVQGVYFASATPATAVIDQVHAPISSIFPVKMPQTQVSTHLVLNKPYFIHGLLRQIIDIPAKTWLNHTGQIAKNDWLKYFSVAGSFIVIVGLSWIWSMQYHNNIKKIASANRSLMEYRHSLHTNTNPSWQTVLSTLETLQGIKANLSDIGQPWILLNTNLSSTIKATDDLYESHLKTVFAPQLAKQLEAELTRSSADPYQLYGALQAYLMLGNPEHADLNWLKSWLKTDVVRSFNLTLTAHLQEQIDNLLAVGAPRINNNPALISQARAALYAQPAPLLAYIILKTRLEEQHFNLLPNNTASTALSDPALADIPSMYTASQFQTIYLEKIPQVCRETTAGNWILGENALEKLSDRQSSHLEQQVREIYINDYSNYWNRILLNLKPAQATSLAELSKNFKDLANPHSAWLSLLEQVITNTQMASLVTSPDVNTDERTQIQLGVSNVFANLAAFLHSDSKTQLQHMLSQTNDYLQTIANSGNSKRSAFLLAKERMQNNAENPLGVMQQFALRAPEPIKSYLIAMNVNSWQLILNDTRDYINQNWQKTAKAYYDEHLSNRYPFFKSSATDTSLKDFQNFFGHDGELERFFNEFLKPFVLTNQAQWNWRQIDNLPLASNTDTLTQIERGMIIQKLFFPEKTNHISLKFLLIPEQLAPTITQFTVQLNQQTFTDKIDDEPKPHALVWPGVENNPTANIIFKTIDQQSLKLSEQGEWAWFKLLDKFPPQPTENAKEFAVTFDLNGNAAQYRLQAQSPLNPFVSGVLEQFRCPEGF